MVDGERSLPLGGARQRAVLALLVIQANATVSVDRLADQLWAGDPPKSAVATLQNYVYRLRRSLAGLPVDIETRPPGYALVVDPERIDAFRFERLLDEGQAALVSGRTQDAATKLREALANWRGPALADFAYEPFAEREIARLTELRLTALEGRVEADLELGQHHELVAELDWLVGEHPLREVLRGHLMLALHRSGRRAEALRVYRQGRDTLIEDLGIEPGQALQRLEHAILMGDAEVEPAPEARPKATAVLSSLPTWMTSFVGRGGEIDALVELVGRHRLVTLTGPGGSGKTRLAVAVADVLAQEGDAAVAMVELAGTHDPDVVYTALATALGARADGDRAPIDPLVDVLQGRRWLVVLDNCEHLREAVAGLAEALLARCPELRLLTTSQERLDVAGELVWPVPALPLTDAVRLFVDRGATVRAGEAPTESELRTIVSICGRLDGMPLAIELAAARLRMLSVGEISRRLDDRFRLLGGGSRSLPARQRTLRAALEWSYELLSGEERAMFEALSVFEGTFTLDAVEAVCVGVDDVGDAWEVLAALLDKSFVSRVAGVDDGDVRFRLLETLRRYGGERLAATGRRQLVEQAHAEHYAAAAERAAAHLCTADRRRWMDALLVDHDDLRSALGWFVDRSDGEGALRLTGALWPFWDFRYLVGEGRGWLRRALELDGAGTRLRLAALVGEAYLAYVDDDLDGANAASEEGLALADRLDDELARARLLVTSSEVKRLENDPAGAEESGTEALAIFGGAGDTWHEGYTIRVLALLAWDDGDLDRAAVLAEECLQLSQSCGDEEGHAGALSMLAGVARDRGDLLQAVELYEASLAGFQRAQERWGTAHVVHYLGVLALDQGDLQRAARLGEESLRLHEELGNQRGVGQALVVMGDAAHAGGNLREAEGLCHRGLAVLRSRGFAIDLTSALHSVASLALRAGQVGRAAALAEEALLPYRDSGQRRGAGPALSVLGVARARKGEARIAVELCEESLALFEGSTNQRGVARALESLAEALLAADDPQRAARTLSAARITRSVVGASLTPIEARDQQRLYEAIRTELGSTAFARQWAAEWETGVIDLRAGRGLAGTEVAAKARGV